MSSTLPQDLENCEAAVSMREKGWYMFPNVLTPAEISKLQVTADNYLRDHGRPSQGGGQKQVNAAVEAPQIGWMLSHPAIINCMRQALGSQQIMYTNHASIQRNVFTGWHKDDGTDWSAGNHGYFRDFPYAFDDCKVFSTGVYLQDHHRGRSGLWVREGSHRVREDNVGPVHYIGARAGSVVVFDCRITHAGDLKTPFQKKFLNAMQHPLFQKGFATARTAYRKLVGRDRIGFFFTYGLPNEHTLRFAEHAMVKQTSFQKGSKPRLSAELHNAFVNQGVLLAEDHLWQDQVATAGV